MKLAFSGQARYADFSDGYALYQKRSKTGDVMNEETYHRVVKDYCSSLADRLEKQGMVDLPRLGTIAAARLTRKAQYRGNKFIGYGAIDWSTGKYDGKLKTFGLVFLPTQKRKQNLRCYGFVANRRLFKRVKASNHILLDYNDEMI